MTKPLECVRILDFTHRPGRPGLYTASRLVLGADVIKVERPGATDFTRSQPRDIPMSTACTSR
jgi:crotonobetainyl-CoA:carnitine CoA-transferase CaiB-like acyl-CoA transferase